MSYINDGAGGLYDHCRICGQLVKLNKFLFGSLHICVPDRDIMEARALQNKQLNSPPLKSIAGGRCSAGAGLSLRTKK